MQSLQSLQHDTVDCEGLESHVSTSDYEEYISLPLSSLNISNSQSDFFENPPWGSLLKQSSIEKKNSLAQLKDNNLSKLNDDEPLERVPQSPSSQVTETDNFGSFISETPQPNSPLSIPQVVLNSQGNSTLLNKSRDLDSLSPTLHPSHSLSNNDTVPTARIINKSIENSHVTNELSTDNMGTSVIESSSVLQPFTSNEMAAETPPMIHFDGLNITLDRAGELFNKPRLRQRNSDQIRPYTVFQKNWNRMVQQNPDLAESDEEDDYNYGDDDEDEIENENENEEAEAEAEADEMEFDLKEPRQKGDYIYFDGNSKRSRKHFDHSTHVEEEFESKIHQKQKLPMDTTSANVASFSKSGQNELEILSSDVSTDTNSDDDDGIPIHRKRLRHRIAIEDESSQEKQNSSDPFEGIPAYDQRILKRAIRKARGSMPASHFIQDYWKQKESETLGIGSNNSKLHNLHSNNNPKSTKGIAMIKKGTLRVQNSTLKNFIDDSSQPNNNVEPYQVLEHENLNTPHGSQFSSRCSSDSDVDLFDNQNFWRSNNFIGQNDPNETHQSYSKTNLQNSKLASTPRNDNFGQPSSVLLNLEPSKINKSPSFPQLDPNISHDRPIISSEQQVESPVIIGLGKSKYLDLNESRKENPLILETGTLNHPNLSTSSHHSDRFNDDSNNVSQLEILGVHNNSLVPQREALEYDVLVTKVNKHRKRLNPELRHSSKKRVRQLAHSEDQGLWKRKKRLKGALPPSYLLAEDKNIAKENRVPNQRPKFQTKLNGTLESTNQHLQIDSEEETFLSSNDNEFYNNFIDVDNDNINGFVTTDQPRESVDIGAFFRTRDKPKDKPEIDYLLSESLRRSGETPQVSKFGNRVSHPNSNKVIRRSPLHQNQRSVLVSTTSQAKPKKRLRPKIDPRIFGRVYAFPSNPRNIHIKKNTGFLNAKDKRVNKLVNDHSFLNYQSHGARDRKVTKSNHHAIHTLSKEREETIQQGKNALIKDWIYNLPSDFEDPFTGETLSYPLQDYEKIQSMNLDQNNGLNKAEKLVAPDNKADSKALEPNNLSNPGVSILPKVTKILGHVSKTKPHQKKNYCSDYSNVFPISPDLTFEKDSFVESGVLQAIVNGIDSNPPNVWAEIFDGPLDVVNFSAINPVFFSHLEKFYNLFLTWCRTPESVTLTEYQITYKFLTLTCRFVASNVSGFNEINSERFLRELRTFMDNCLSLGLTENSNETIKKIAITSLTFSIALVLPLFSSLTSIRSDIVKPIFYRFSTQVLRYFEKFNILSIIQHTKHAEKLRSDQYYILELAVVIVNLHNKAFQIQTETSLSKPALSGSLHIFGLLDTLHNSTTLDELESTWKSFYTFIPLLSFKSFVSVDSDLYWEMIVTLLEKTIKFINNNDLTTEIIIKGSLRFPKYLSDKHVFYLHAVLSRIYNLLVNWKWNGNKQVVKLLFDFFFNRDFYNVEKWRVKSPLELTVLDEYKLENRDSCFVQFLKLYATTVEYFIQHNNSLSIIHEINIVKVFSYHREDPLEETDLEALDNMYAFLLLRHKLAPLKLRLSRSQLSEFVNPRAIHASARYSVLKAWDSFMDIQLHRKGTRLLIAKDWFYNILGWTIKEYLLLLEYFKDKPNLLKFNTVPYIRFLVSAFTELKHWLSIEYVSHKDWKILLSSFFAKSIFTDGHVPEGIFELYFSVLESYVDTASQLASPDFSNSGFQPPRTKETALKEIAEWFADPEIFTFKKFISIAFRKNDASDFSDSFIHKAINTYTLCAEFLIKNKSYSLDNFIADYSEASSDISKSNIYFPLFLAQVLDQFSKEQFTLSEKMFLSKWMGFLVTEEINYEPEYAKALLKKSPSIFTSEELESLSIFVESYSWNRSSIIKIVISSIKRLMESNDWNEVNLGKNILSSLTSVLISFVSIQNSKEDFHLLCLDSIQRIRETFPDIMQDEILAVLNKYESKTEKIISNLKNKLTSKAFIRSSHHQHILNFITKKRDDYIEIFLKTLSSSFKDGVFVEDSTLRAGRELFLKYTLAPYFLICRKGVYNHLIFLPPLCDLALKLVEFQASSVLYYPRSAVTFLIASMADYLAVSPLLTTSSLQERIFLEISWKVFRTVLKLARLQLFWIKDLLLCLEEKAIFVHVLEMCVIIYGRHATNMAGLELSVSSVLKEYERSDILKGFFGSTSETNSFKYDQVKHSWVLNASNPPKGYTPDPINLVEYKRLALDEVYRLFREIYHMNNPLLTSQLTGHFLHLIESICEKDDALSFLLAIISQSNVENSQLTGNFFIDSLA